jgi:hypothetical protein
MWAVAGFAASRGPSVTKRTFPVDPLAMGDLRSIMRRNGEGSLTMSPEAGIHRITG